MEKEVTKHYFYKYYYHSFLPAAAWSAEAEKEHVILMLFYVCCLGCQ